MSSKTELRTIQLGEKTISYTMEWKPVKNINMRMCPEKGLTVSASPRLSIHQVEDAIRQNQSRILETLYQYDAKQREKVQQYPLTYTTGETVLYCGRMLPLEVAGGTVNTVQVKENKLLLIVKQPTDATMRERVFDNWWNTTCERAVRNLCRAVYPIYQSQGVAYPEIRFRSMVAQWGNCRPNLGVLTFNTRLLAAPVRCIEYVVIHEFTHFLHPDHSPAFYRCIAQEIPDWKALQELLQKTVETRSIYGCAEVVKEKS